MRRTYVAEGAEGVVDTAGAFVGMASFAWSGYCLCKYSIMKAIGFAGFSEGAECRGYYFYLLCH